MRHSEWNGHHARPRPHHHSSKTTPSLSPPSSISPTPAPSILPVRHGELPKSHWTYVTQPYGDGGECSSSSAATTGSQLHRAAAAIGATTSKPISIRHNDLDCTTGSSSLTSTATFSDNAHRRLIGLPSITTTSTFLEKIFFP
ncbi:unnamed protein product [Gongylonema pulchrum]|uniref:Uncharacterized protein n=1 Tax=Gongylonema pulchrum TaxID=637853 RepID=A0A183CWW0_9BILA|nr:unnamed protein product [Gongylonema pulchrum]